MSLINEALKKAQKQRTHEPVAHASAGSAPAPRVAKRKQPMPAQTLVVIGVLCLVLIVALAGGAWFVLKQSSTHINAVADAKAAATLKTTVPSTPAASTTEPAAIATATTPSQSATPGAQAAGVTTPPTISPAAVPTTSPVVASTSPSTTAPAVAAPGPAVKETHPAALPTTAAVVATTPSHTPAAGTTATPEPVEVIEITSSQLMPRVVPPNPQVLAVVDTFKVSGIRASASDPKVLMNDRVFRLNDIVERNHGLRLTEIHTDRLTFIDQAGAVYSKSF